MAHKTTNYGSGIASQHGRLTLGGKPYTAAGYEDVARAYQHMLAWRDGRGLTTANSRAETEKLRAQMEKLYPAYMQEQYQAMMAEYMGAMSEALNKEEPAAEPLKAAQEVQTEARADTARKQLLRRGLMSTMTRYGGQGGGARLQLGA